MNMDHIRNRVNARKLPALWSASQGPTVASWQGPLHLQEDLGVVKNVQESSQTTRDINKRHRSNKTCRLGSWNIGTLTGKTLELVESMRRRRISIMCLQETKWVGEKAKVLDTTGYKLWYSGKDRTRNGVGIIVDPLFVKQVVGVVRKGDRIIALKIIIGNEPINVISVYAPQVGLDEHIKLKFWDDLESLVQTIPQNEKIIIGGDLNGHVGTDNEDYERVHGGYGFGTRNNEGKAILDFAVAYDFVINNTLFKKREEHLITFKSGSNKSQIDYFLVRKSDRKLCKNCKVIPGESLATQHRVLVLDIRLNNNQRVKKTPNIPRIKWWDLKNKNKREMFTKALLEDINWKVEKEADVTWVGISNQIRSIAKKILGESKGSKWNKESWWWNQEIQEKVKAKRASYKTLYACRNNENLERYKNAKKDVRKVISEAKTKAFENFYQKLDTKEGEKDIYKIARMREKKTRDLTQIKCIKDEHGNVLVDDKVIKDRWKGYFHKLFNEVGNNEIVLGELDQSEKNKNYTYCRKIQTTEVEKALHRMKTGKAIGPDDIPIEAWRCLGKVGIQWLTSLFNVIMTTRNMPNQWRESVLIPLYKNKGDIQDCANYRGIKLMCHTMKLWERVIETRLRKETSILENQFGFMPGRSTMEAIHLIRRLCEHYNNRKQDLHMIFIDLEKAYDRVNRDIMWRVLEKRGVRVAYIEIIKDMYKDVTTCIRTPVGSSSDFPNTIGLHQGSTLSPYLFTLVIDEITKHLQKAIPECMLFADDIVLIDETRVGVNAKLEAWREALESKGFTISRAKTEYMKCNFSNRRNDDGMKVKIGEHELNASKNFKYLGSILQENGGLDKDTTHRIQAGWNKWRSASSILCDRKIPLKLKGKFYKTAIRPAMLYGTECWATKYEIEQKMRVAEMRMLRWMCGHTRLDRISNECIRKKVSVAAIDEKMRESRLRWFGHVRRRPLEAPVRRVENIEALTEIKRGRGRPKKSWKETIKNDLTCLGMTENMCLDRARWRHMIHIADPT